MQRRAMATFLADAPVALKRGRLGQVLRANSPQRLRRELPRSGASPFPLAAASGGAAGDPGGKQPTSHTIVKHSTNLYLTRRTARFSNFPAPYLRGHAAAGRQQPVCEHRGKEFATFPAGSRSQGSTSYFTAKPQS
ncbi:hypothetical protein AK812_SmicGene25200 [Symbiodinium microadriaticum]|uniref:Uncharacterized protein n=1 Tax=Symbiodinium microadriaticum TaxID=2951 RepID=A0A1Q9DCT1_SYMMI|nr:hypothetical protein AK812_SmicGene25200 [Symbiodinium microadriaticum]